MKNHEDTVNRIIAYVVTVDVVGQCSDRVEPKVWSVGRAPWDTD